MALPIQQGEPSIKDTEWSPRLAVQKRRKDDLPSSSFMQKIGPGHRTYDSEVVGELTRGHEEHRDRSKEETSGQE